MVSGEPSHRPAGSVPVVGAVRLLPDATLGKEAVPQNPQPLGRAQGHAIASLQDKLKRVKVTSAANPHLGQEVGRQGLNL